MLNKKPKIEYSNHDGQTFETAIIITGARTAPVGIDAEYKYVTSKLGIQNVDWKLVLQSLYHTEDGSFDILEVKTKETLKTYHFNITEFFDKY